MTTQALRHSREPVLVLCRVIVRRPITAFAAAPPRRKVTISGRRRSGLCGGPKEGPQGRNGSVNLLVLRWRGTIISPLVCHLLGVSSDTGGIVTSAMGTILHKLQLSMHYLSFCYHNNSFDDECCHVASPQGPVRWSPPELWPGHCSAFIPFGGGSQLLALQLRLQRGAGEQDGPALRGRESWLDVQPLACEGCVAGPRSRRRLHGRGDTLVPLGCGQQSGPCAELVARKEFLSVCKKNIKIISMTIARVQKVCHIFKGSKALKHHI